MVPAAVALTLSLVLGQLPEPEPAEASSAYAFAESLLEEGDHYRAIGEYKRYLFLAPAGANVDAARMAIGLAYLRGGQADAAREHFLRSVKLLPDALKPEAALQAAYARYVGSRPYEAYADLNQWLVRWSPSAASASTQRAHYLIAWTELEIGKDEQAALELRPLDFPGKPLLELEVAKFKRLPQRSPLVAGLLSIIPGAGHVYIGQPWIGVSALLFNGIFGYALYSAAREGQIGAAVVIGFFELLWYTGAIFGAVSGAMKFNRDARRNAIDELRERFDDRPESWPPAPPKEKAAPRSGPTTDP